jgi:glycosyltransferase involved in cell wall biosynthesis
MKVIFIHPTDLRYDHDAITNYIRFVMRMSGVSCEYWGASSEPLVQLFGSDDLKFKPLFSKGGRKIVPLTVKYLAHFWLARRYLPLQHTLLSIHEVEWALPFLWPYKVVSAVVTIHGASKFIRLATRKKVKIALHMLADKVVVEKADKVILVSRDAYEYYRQRYPSYAHKFVYIPTFVDPEVFFPRQDRFVLRSRYDIKPHDKVIMYSGRFVKEKGLEILIDAFAELEPGSKNLKLVLVGDGPLSSWLNYKIHSHFRDSAQIWRTVSHSRMPEVLNCADIFVLPSQFEATPLVVLEALACGVPVVSFPVGDLPYIIVDGFNGFLAPRRSPSSLAESIGRCLPLLQETADLQKRCRESVMNFYADKVVPQIVAAYLTIRKHG